MRRVLAHPITRQCLLWAVATVAEAVLGRRPGRRAALRGVFAGGMATTVVRLFGRLGSHRPIDGPWAVATSFVAAGALEAPKIALPISSGAAALSLRSARAGGPPPPVALLGGVVVGGLATAITTRVWPLVDHTPAAARTVSRHADVEPSSTGQGLVIVVNAASGPSAHDELLAEVLDALPDAEVVKVDDPSQLDTRLLEAAAAATVLGVVGGDGTIGAGASAALEVGVPLAVFPGGTLNHFARDVGVDTVAGAVAAIREGQLVEVDIARIDGRIFLNTASFGGYSEFVEAREQLEDRIGKWPAAMVALGRVLVSGQPFELTLDGRPMKVWLVFIGNCAYDPPGFAPATRSRLDDGRLDVRMVDGSEPMARTRLVLAVLTGRLLRSGVYSTRLVERLDIATPESSTTLAADGEIFEGRGSFVVEKSPTRLRVFAPRTGDASVP